MKQLLLLSVAFVAGTLMSAGSAHEDSARKLRELHRERVETLQQLIQDLESQKSNRQVSRDEIMQTNLQLLRAQLDAAQSNNERMTLHQNIVDLMSEWEDMAEQVVKKAHVERSLYLKAKADRLKAEIDMEQERL